jgi:hypothetical protein
MARAALATLARAIRLTDGLPTGAPQPDRLRFRWVRRAARELAGESGESIMG